MNILHFGQSGESLLGISTWNADAEQSFSANKDTVTAERTTLREDTITAIPLMKDRMRHTGKSASNQ